MTYSVFFMWFALYRIKIKHVFPPVFLCHMVTCCCRALLIWETFWRKHWMLLENRNGTVSISTAEHRNKIIKHKLTNLTTGVLNRFLILFPTDMKEDDDLMTKTPVKRKTLRHWWVGAHLYNHKTNPPLPILPHSHLEGPNPELHTGFLYPPHPLLASHPPVLQDCNEQLRAAKEDK